MLKKAEWRGLSTEIAKYKPPGFGTEGKTIYTFIFININMKALKKRTCKISIKFSIQKKKSQENLCANFLYWDIVIFIC